MRVYFFDRTGELLELINIHSERRYSSKNNATLVTAAHAIFIDHKGHKAPAAVVGLQFQHDSLARHFINITTSVRKRNRTLLSVHQLLYSFIHSVHWNERWMPENMCIR